MSSTAIDNNKNSPSSNIELEEGEIAEDSNDDGSLDDTEDFEVGNTSHNNNNNSNNNTRIINNDNPDASSEPQKKRKKVVRKVRRKIKIKKKVVRKKGANNPNNNANNSGIVGGGLGGPTNTTTAAANTTTTGANNAPLGCAGPGGLTANTGVGGVTASLLNLANNTIVNPSANNTTVTMSTSTPTVTFSVGGGGGGGGSGGGGGGGGTGPAGAAGGDPRLSGGLGVGLASGNNNTGNQSLSLWEQQILMLQELQRQQPDQETQILRAAATDEDLRIFGPPLQPITINSAVVNTLISSRPTPMTAQNNMPLLAGSKPLSSLASTSTSSSSSTTITTTSKPFTTNTTTDTTTTPSSPDDENGKSSYEAISKMLTLLRNSANDSEPQDTVQYKLVPILVDGIDYTKYKLLSQFEPKFNNDPRLNQQVK